MSAEPIKGWPAEVSKVEIPCSDGAKQPAIWFTPAAKGKKPLLVGLHTWSSNFASAGGDAVYAKWCIDQGWAFVHPDFRGPNWTPPALGSDRAVQDVVEAVAWAKAQTEVDESRIYLIGVSGGGHMAMLMAGRHPELWAGVSAWCGIVDIAQWHREHVKDGKPDRYAQNIEAALSAHRPPMMLMRGIARPSRICKTPPACHSTSRMAFTMARKGSVPFTHAMLAFNEVAAQVKVAREAIQAYYGTQKLPAGWAVSPPMPVLASTRLFFAKRTEIRA
ncbi:MAG: prolyl oligopeptidase family serine peptidase [Verrucomicrobiaceae bacterium]